ncbi:18643_t:CDS:2 [Rhizophagus irregularis]|nr:18643_t:CDS:2 [Rhizophagus irregularis]
MKYTLSLLRSSVSLGNAYFVKFQRPELVFRPSFGSEPRFLGLLCKERTLWDLQRSKTFGFMGWARRSAQSPWSTQRRKFTLHIWWSLQNWAMPNRWCHSPRNLFRDMTAISQLACVFITLPSWSRDHPSESHDTSDNDRQ